VHDLYYAAAREHERELLRLARKERIGSVPARERTSPGHGARLLRFLIRRRPTLRPAAERG